MNLHKFSIVLCVMGSVGYTTALYYPQYYQAFSYDYCIGTPVDFLETNTNVTKDYPNLVVKTTTLRGLWRTIRNKGGLTATTVLRSVNGKRTCSKIILGNDDTIPINSTEKLASGDLDDSVLTLFQAGYNEKLVVGVDGISKLNTSFNISSWALTGIQGFTLFDGEDFTGNSTCLDAEPQAKEAGYGISVELNASPRFVVKSVKFGCDQNVTNIRTGNPDMLSLSWDENGNVVEGFEVVEQTPKVIKL